MVKISLPILDGVSAEQLREFYAAHLPDNTKFEVVYTDTGCVLTCPSRHAAACKVLYRAIPDYLSCVL